MTSLQVSTICHPFNLNSQLRSMIPNEDIGAFYCQLQNLKGWQISVCIPLVHTHTKEAKMILIQKLRKFGIEFAREEL